MEGQAGRGCAGKGREGVCTEGPGVCAGKGVKADCAGKARERVSCPSVSLSSPLRVGSILPVQPLSPRGLLVGEGCRARSG